MKFEPSKRASWLCLLALGLLAAGAAAATKDDDPEFKKTCFQDLLVTYGLEGLQKPEVMSLEMCVNVKKSCCMKKDQEAIYTNWVHGQDEEKLQKHYDTLERTYTDLMNHMMQVHNYAASIRDVVVKKVSNCKLLAERVLNYEINEVHQQILENIQGMREFFQKTYKGFYCVICNHEYHQYFKKDASTVIFDQGFCRQIIEESLTTLLLFHIDIVKLLNLTTRLLTNCDFKGDYSLEAIYPKNFVFKQVKDNVTTLKGCRDNRNKREWFSYCKDICMSFKMVEFPKFFEANLPEIIKYNKYLKERFKEINDEKARHPLFGQLVGPEGAPNNSTQAAGAKPKQAKKDASKPAKPARVLEGDKKGGEKKGADKGEGGKAEPIYKPGMIQKVPLQSWKVEFEEQGIPLGEEGGGTNISEDVFNSVKTLLQMAREGGPEQATTLSSVEKEMLKKQGKNRSLKGAALPSALSALLIALFWLKW